MQLGFLSVVSVMHIHRKIIFIREVKRKSGFTHNIYIFDYFIYIYFPLVLVPCSPSLEKVQLIIMVQDWMVGGLRWGC